MAREIVWYKDISPKNVNMAVEEVSSAEIIIDD
jgi:(2Fe-2S) ferredoxin